MLTRRKALITTAAGLLARPARAEIPVIRLAYREEPDPYWRQPDGPALRVLDEVVVRRAGYRLAYVPLPWRRAIAAIEAAEVDATFTAYSASTRARRILAITETPLMRMHQGLLYARSHPERAKLESAASLEALRPLTYVYVETDNFAREAVEAYGPGVPMPTIESMVKAVAAGRGDFALLQVARLEGIIADLGLGDELVVRPVGWRDVNWYFGLRAGFPDAAAIVARIDAAARAAWRAGVIDRLQDPAPRPILKD